MLLDTNALLWLVSGRLSERSQQEIKARAHVYFSSVSITEITIKSMLGKLQITREFAELLPTYGLTSLPFTDRHADTLFEFPELARHDPFDRMLLAQARAEGIDFLTSDRRLLSLGLPRVLDAR